MRRVLSILVENEPGALSRVANLFSARSYNIESLSVAPTEEITLSRITIVTEGDENTIEQITKQVNKLIEVFKVIDITDKRHFERELMLIKVAAQGPSRRKIKTLIDTHGAVIINTTPDSYLVQIAGEKETLDSFITAVGLTNLLDIARTGVCGLPGD